MIHLPSLCLINVFSFIDSIKLNQLRLISQKVKDFIDENIHIIQKNDIMVLTFAFNKTILSQPDDIYSKNYLGLSSKLILPHVKCKFFVDQLKSMMFIGFVSTIDSKKIIYHALPILNQDFPSFTHADFYFLHFNETNKFGVVLFFQSLKICARLDIELREYGQIKMKSSWLNTTLGLDSFSTLFHNFKPLLFENFKGRVMFQDHYKFIYWSPLDFYVLKSFDFNGNLLYESKKLKIVDNFSCCRNYICVCPWIFVADDCDRYEILSIFDFKNKIEYVLKENLVTATCVYCSDSQLLMIDKIYFYLVDFTKEQVYRSISMLKAETPQFYLYCGKLFAVDNDGIKFIDLKNIKQEMLNWYDEVGVYDID